MKQMLHVVLAAALVLSACSSKEGPSDAGTDAGIDAGVSVARLSSSSKYIVDPSGNRVMLRGVNLGGWMFNETWITQIDYSTFGRAWALADQDTDGAEIKAAVAAAGVSGSADPAEQSVCPANGAGWLARFEPELKKRIGDAKTAAFLARLESYPSICDDADMKLRALLASRFGLEARDWLMDVFERAWLKEEDIRWLAEQGFNVVRVPITYRNLTSMPDAERPDALVWNPMTFERLDEMLAWCERHGVYAVIDMQEVPGGQNTYAGKSWLWEDPKMQELTVQLWEHLSDRYKGRNIVAAYSLMAEPYGAPDTDARDAMYDRLIKAIRAKGDDHLLVVHDGFFGMSTLPKPSKYGWTGVVYSTHIFEWDINDLHGYEVRIAFYRDIFADAQKTQGVPYYIGSFSTKKDQPWAYEGAGMLVDWYEEKSYSWSLWTFKRIDDPLANQLWQYSTQWGLLGRLDSAFDRPDIYLDSRETIEAKFAAYKDLKIAPNEALLKKLIRK